MSDDDKKALMALAVLGVAAWFFFYRRPAVAGAGGNQGGASASGGFNAGAAFLDMLNGYGEGATASGAGYLGEGADKTAMGNEDLMTIDITQGYIPGADGYRRSTVTGERLLDENGDPIPN